MAAAGSHSFLDVRNIARVNMRCSLVAAIRWDMHPHCRTDTEVGSTGADNGRPFFATLTR